MDSTIFIIVTNTNHSSQRGQNVWAPIPIKLLVLVLYLIHQSLHYVADMTTCLLHFDHQSLEIAFCREYELALKM